jgi:hypothetical protein
MKNETTTTTPPATSHAPYPGPCRSPFLSHFQKEFWVFYGP